MTDATLTDVRERTRHRRGEPRESMLLSASIRVDGEGEAHTVRIRNISAGGFMADCPLRLEKGGTVMVELRTVGAVSGHIAWADGVRIGVAFVDPIDPHLVRRPVASAEGQRMLVRRPGVADRRPGLKIR